MATEQHWSKRAATLRGRGRGGPKAETGGPDVRKFERETALIDEKIKGLENKLKPVASNATQLIAAEIHKETAEAAEIEKAKEANSVEMKAIDSKIREVGAQYKEKRIIFNDLRTGVRHKTESHHDDAVERLEQQILIRRCSSAEEKKFRHEIEALKKSREQLVEYRAAKSIVDDLKQEQEDLRARRSRLHREHKDLRLKEISCKDRIAHLKQELEEAKERKKVSATEREELKKEIDGLHKERRQLYNRFRSEQHAYTLLLQQQSEEEKMRRDQYRAVWEARRKYRAIEEPFQQQQQYMERITTCNALISHLQRLSLNSHTGVSDLDIDLPTSATLDSTPQRSESDPTNSTEGFILRRERDEVLVPTTVNLKRKRSKKEKKRNTPIVAKKLYLQLNPTIFRQFGSLDLAPPSTHSDIPQVLSLLQDKLAYYKGMTKAQMYLPPELMFAVDSGLGSTAPSELLDPVDREFEFSNSQEDGILDPGLGSTVSPKRSLSEAANGTIPTATVPQRSATDVTPNTKTTDVAPSSALSDNSLVKLYDSVTPHNLVTMVSSSTTNGSGTSLAVGGTEE